MVAREKYAGVNLIAFYKKNQSDEDCLKYLSEIKWENGFVCKKCWNTTFCKGKER